MKRFSYEINYKIIWMHYLTMNTNYCTLTKILMKLRNSLHFLQKRKFLINFEYSNIKYYFICKILRACMFTFIVTDF